MINFLAAFFVSIAVQSSSTSDVALDVWFGTFEVRGKSIYIKRCDIGQTLYKLEPLRNRRILDKVPMKAVKAGEPVSAAVVGSYKESKENSDQHTLLVESINDIEIGKSCHLTDSLKN